MHGFKKSPLNRFAKHNTADPGFSASSGPNPFDSDSDSDNKPGLNPSKRTSSESSLVTLNSNTNPFDYDERKQTFSTSAAKYKYKNDFRDYGGLESQSEQELEGYAAYKSEETTKTYNNCLKISVDMRDTATNTLVSLHQQSEQITRTHTVAADIDHDLSRGEKLLGSLGGIFSKTWKPKKNRRIKGPFISRDDSFIRRGTHLEQRERLGISPVPKGQSSSRTLPLEPTNTLQKVEMEKAKQDDALSEISNILGELKVMAVDMGSEIERQNKALDHFHDDADELNFRVRGANQRTRHLLGK